MLTSDFRDGKIHPIIKIIQSLLRVGGGTWSFDPTATSSNRTVLIPAGVRFWPGKWGEEESLFQIGREVLFFVLIHSKYIGKI
ncbi:hypothetical protein PROCOU_16769 [Listeria rocourtiae FSL F6-920]|nr:hypothetical protein PROCOU_16769 [Listeria rocourtiae FSL F6-920]